MVEPAEKRVEGFCLIKTSEFCMVTTSMAVSQSRTELLQILTRIDERISLTVGMPKHVQKLCFECDPISALITAHHQHRLADRFRAVVGKHYDDVSAERVSSSEGANALIHVEKCRRVRAKKDRRAWTKRKWHLIPVSCRSRDGLNV